MAQDLEHGTPARHGDAGAGTHDGAREAHGAAAHVQRVQRGCCGAAGVRLLLVSLLVVVLGLVLAVEHEGADRVGTRGEAELRGGRDEAACAHLGGGVQGGTLLCAVVVVAGAEHDERGSGRGVVVGHSNGRDSKRES